MIRVNLLGLPKAKKSMTIAPDFSAGPNIFLVLLIAFVVTAAVNGAWWYRLKAQTERLNRDLAAAEAENRVLADVKKHYLEREKQKNEFKRRVDVIDQLRNNQRGPVRLLTAVSDTVNATDAVWLNTMTDDGTNVNIKGRSLSVKGIASLMRNLQQTGLFKTVEIKETVQDSSMKDMQAFTFTLICEKAQKS